MAVSKRFLGEEKENCGRRKPPEPLNRRQSNGWNIAVAVICALLFAVIFFNLWFEQRFLVVEVSGGSMETTLFDGDILYADRQAKPQRGDVVIIDVSKYGSVFRGELIIKRIIGMEGDALKCEDNAVYLRKAGTSDFVLLDEPYLEFVTGDFDEVVVGEGEIFFMGDHRTNSTDSRRKEVGCLKLSDVLGVVPEWAIRWKDKIAAWESLRTFRFR